MIREERNAQTGRKKGSIGRLLGRLIDGVMGSSFEISRDGDRLFIMPSIVLVVLLVLGPHWVVPAMIIALFFRVRYRFEGAFHSLNELLDKTSDLVDSIKKQFFRTEDGEGFRGFTN